MARRSTRVKEFTQAQRLEVLAELNRTRSYICDLNGAVQPFSYDYGAVNRVRDAIDDLAEAWTGDRTYLHLKPHSAGAGGGH